MSTMANIAFFGCRNRTCSKPACFEATVQGRSKAHNYLQLFHYLIVPQPPELSNYYSELLHPPEKYKARESYEETQTLTHVQ
jgi:hypothetical protein